LVSWPLLSLLMLLGCVWVRFFVCCSGLAYFLKLWLVLLELCHFRSCFFVYLGEWHATVWCLFFWWGVGRVVWIWRPSSVASSFSGLSLSFFLVCWVLWHCFAFLLVLSAFYSFFSVWLVSVLVFFIVILTALFFLFLLMAYQV
jgi:hypothetical protein